jgi:NAD(P)-dependent dehydrogenase (short-subunit alcohol dehydrogenase family)
VSAVWARSSGPSLLERRLQIQLIRYEFDGHKGHPTAIAFEKLDERLNSIIFRLFQNVEISYMLEKTSIAALAPGRGAIITGGASGIGLATARQLANFGMRICIVDRDREALKRAEAQLTSIARDGAADIVTEEADVSVLADVERVAKAAFKQFDDIAFLMNNAAAFEGGDVFSDRAAWRRILDVNVLGVLNGVQSMGRMMIDRGKSGFVVNTGSKQGITSPPGNTAYNVSKAAVKTLTEGLAYTLRNLPACQISAHLLIPGFTYTANAARRMPTRPAAAWAPEEVAARLIQGLERNEFYILCQDNETTRDQDERRILWAAGDLVENRPALSRWHPDYKEAFEAFMRMPR